MALSSCFLPYTHGVEVGETAPKFTLPDIHQSTSITLDSYKGKIVLVDFWASWCGPCRKSLPFFTDLKKEHANKPFEILAINLDESAEDGKDFLKKINTNYPILYAGADSNLPQKYGVEAMPTSFIIDAQGKIWLIHKGMKDNDKSVVRYHIKEALKGL
ncbi:thiol:disulfide interchange protein [Marinibactrum halimedae]|uniref:Thiol:disulfide interchange protein n=1 Tax=Marinibactrum halimedae TaxID=1444977 RepID=A0AA37T2V0_9GAMM|nr:thiol:disulfide interchange protein [Marinibactrum halimedae]